MAAISGVLSLSYLTFSTIIAGSILPGDCLLCITASLRDSEIRPIVLLFLTDSEGANIMTTSPSSWIIPAITGVIALLLGALLFFMVILGLNGFTEKQAEPMLLATLVLILGNIVLSAWLSGWLTRMMQARTEVSMWLIGPLAVLGATLVGGMLLMVGIFIGLLILSFTYK